jgi:hypothetical protein
MKFRLLFIIILIAGFYSCHNPKKIIINGEIIGGTAENIKYTVPIHGICFGGFQKSVQPDSLGKFKIEIESDKEAFIKLMMSNGRQGTLISEPGKTYYFFILLKKFDFSWFL